MLAAIGLKPPSTADVYARGVDPPVAPRGPKSRCTVFSPTAPKPSRPEEPSGDSPFEPLAALTAIFAFRESVI